MLMLQILTPKKRFIALQSQFFFDGPKRSDMLIPYYTLFYDQSHSIHAMNKEGFVNNNENNDEVDDNDTDQK